MHLKIEEYVTKQFIIAVCLNLGHIMTGYSMGWSSPVLEKLLDKHQSPLSDVITSSEVSWVASSYMAGIILGPILLGFLANRIGRKPCIILSSLNTLLGYVLVAVGLNITWIYCGQVIKGLGISGIVLMDCMYIGEIASPNIRGIILSSTCVFHTFGILLVYAVGPYVDYRVVNYVIIVIIIAHVSSCGYFIPESPVFYVLKNKEDDAKKALRELGRSKDIDTELKTMTEQLKDNQTNTSCLDLVKIKSNRMAMIITSILLVLNQGGGILCVLFYATIIFKSAASSVPPEIASIILGATQFVGAIVTPFFIEKCGRRTLLLVSTALSTLFLTILGLYFYLELIKYSAIDSLRWLPLFALVSYLFSFSFGVNVIPGTILGETFRPNMRSLGCATAVTLGCVAGFISTSTFGYIVSSAGSYTAFWIYAVINLIGFLFTWFIVPETKGKTLMEIEAMLG